MVLAISQHQAEGVRLTAEQILTDFNESFTCLNCSSSCADNLVLYQCSHLSCKQCFDVTGRCVDKTCSKWDGMPTYKITFTSAYKSMFPQLFDVNLTHLKEICRLESKRDDDWLACVTTTNDERIMVSIARILGLFDYSVHLFRKFGILIFLINNIVTNKSINHL